MSQPGVMKEVERAGKVAKFDADFLQQRSALGFDRREALFAEDIWVSGIRARDVRNKNVGPLGARRSARLPARGGAPSVGGLRRSDMAGASDAIGGVFARAHCDGSATI